MAQQLTLNLKSRITTGKKLARLSVPCSDEFLALVDKVAAMKGTTRAEFSYSAVLEGIKEAIGEVFLVELHGDKKVSDFFE